MLAAALRLQAIEGHGPGCLACAEVRREAAELDFADRELELREAEAAARQAGAELERLAARSRAERWSARLLSPERKRSGEQ